MAADFSYLKDLAVTRETTREYTFPIRGDASVIVSPATDDNEDFLNGRLELALTDAPPEDEKAKKRKPGDQLTPDELKGQYAKSREVDCQLIAHCCIRSWGTPPVDTKGKPVEFSAENAHQFLLALPNYILGPFRGYCGNIYNFTPKPESAKVDGENLGNS